MTTLNKSLYFSFFRNISFCIFKRKNLLLFAGQKFVSYIFIPEGTTFSVSETSLIFKSDKSGLNSFFFLSQFKNFGIVFVKKKLKLRGLGFRLTLSPSVDILEMKLGFSLPVYVHIPLNYLKITLEKSTLVVEGGCKIKVGNFISIIRSIKITDIYKGNGFLSFYEKKLLKSIKKK